MTPHSSAHSTSQVRLPSVPPFPPPPLPRFKNPSACPHPPAKLAEATVRANSAPEHPQRVGSRTYPQQTSSKVESRPQRSPPSSQADAAAEENAAAPRPASAPRRNVPGKPVSSAPSRGSGRSGEGHRKSALYKGSPRRGGGKSLQGETRSRARKKSFPDSRPRPGLTLSAAVAAETAPSAPERTLPPARLHSQASPEAPAKGRLCHTHRALLTDQAGAGSAGGSSGETRKPHSGLGSS